MQSARLHLDAEHLPPVLQKAQLLQPFQRLQRADSPAGIGRQCCARAEGYGVLLYGNTFTPGEIRIITENGDFAARLPKLFQKAFGVKFDRVPEETNGKGKLIFGITAPEKLEKIINTLGYDARQLTALHVNFGILEEDCCRTAFLRGAFLAGGSVTDPEKRYHLELATSHVPASREVQALMEEMVYDDEGQHLNANLLEYLLPTAMDMPDLELSHIETPSIDTVAGIKGAAEGGLTGAVPAIANAVGDALAGLGVNITRVPLRPSYIFGLIREARAAKEAAE